MRNVITLFFCSLFIVLSCQVRAQDRFFAFTAQSNVLPKGTRAIEIWYANKSGGQVFYHGNFTRVGLKMGLGNNILTQFYANFDDVAQIESGINHADHTTRLYSPNIVRETGFSFSNETKIKLLDPIANPVGLAFYNEFTIGSTFRRITPKLIMDKRVGNNFFVFNALYEFSKTWQSTASTSGTVAPTITTVSEHPFEFGFGYLHFSKNNKFGVGFEIRDHNEIFDIAGWEHSALFLGPALHFSEDKWFFNITALPQIVNLRKSWIAPESRVLDEHQAFELRTQLGFMF